MSILASELLDLNPDDLEQYKLHLATNNGINEPLDVFAEDFDDWVGWNRYRGDQDAFSRKYIFSLIDYYHEKNKWLFGGIFEVVGRHEDRYEVDLQELHRPLIGRLIIDFHRYQGLLNRAYYLETFFDDFTVSEILKCRYEASEFPGLDQINISFGELQRLVRTDRRDWRSALQSLKGVYLIFDTASGKNYVGAAYSGEGIWSRWSSYAQTGHGWNEGLRELIDEKGVAYAREHLRFTLLEHRPMRVDDNEVMARETYWKKVLLSRGDYGYNRN